MARLLPVGLNDPLVQVGEPVRNPFGRAWQFHYDVNCCGSPGYAHFSVNGGKPAMLDSVESLEQWMRSALTTVRQKYRAYSGRFGTDFSSVIGERGPEVTTVAESIVVEALEYDPRISNVTAEATLSAQYGINIRVAVETVDGAQISISDFSLEG